MAERRRGPCFGQRHILAFCLTLGLVLLFSMRLSLSVALVAMVNDTDAQTHHNRSSDHNDCPQPSANASGAPSTPGPAPASVGPQFPWSRQLQGLVLSSFFWGYILLQVPAGALAQRYGAKWMFGAGVAWTSVLTLLTPVVAKHSVYLLIVLRAVDGLGESITFPAILAMLGRWAPPQESNRLMSIAMTGASLGTIVGQMTAGPICSSELLGGWPSVFYINGAVGLLWLVPWCCLTSNSPSDHPRITREERDYITEAIGTDQKRANAGSVPWRRILLSVPVWVYTIVNTVGYILSYTMYSCLPQFLSDVLHFDISTNGIVASLPYIGYASTANLFTWMCDTLIARGCLSKTNARKLLSLIALWASGACLFAIPFIKCSPLAVIALVVVGYTLSSSNFAGFYGNPLDLSPEYAGSIFGFGNVFATAAGIGSPLMTDAITANKTAAEWNTVFFIISGSCGGAGLLFLLLGSAQRQDWSGQLGQLASGYRSIPGDEEKDGEETTTDDEERQRIVSVNVSGYGIVDN